MEKYNLMWEELKATIRKDKEFYADGSMCSMAEAIHGELQCDRVLSTMESIERKYKGK